MKTTTHIIISLLAATVVLTLVSPVFDVVPDKPVVYLDKMKTIHVREIADIVSVDSALENLVSEDNYIVSLEANDSLKDVVVNYPYQFVEVRMQGRTLHLALLPTLRGEDMTPLSMELMPNEQASDSVVAGERLEAVVRIQMPSAMLRDFLSRVNHASLRCVSLLVNGVRGDSLSFRRDLNLALADCAFDVAEVTVPGKMLRLSRTKIGKLTFHTVPSGDGGTNGLYFWHRLRVFRPYHGRTDKGLWIGCRTLQYQKESNLEVKRWKRKTKTNFICAVRSTRRNGLSTKARFPWAPLSCVATGSSAERTI